MFRAVFGVALCRKQATLYEIDRAVSVEGGAKNFEEGLRCGPAG